MTSAKLEPETMHSYTIAQVAPADLGRRAAGRRRALYPALQRLEVRGLLKAKCGVSDNNRRAQYYTLIAQATADSSEKPPRGPASPRSSLGSCRPAIATVRQRLPR